MCTSSQTTTSSYIRMHACRLKRSYVVVCAYVLSLLGLLQDDDDSFFVYNAYERVRCVFTLILNLATIFRQSNNKKYEQSAASSDHTLYYSCKYFINIGILVWRIEFTVIREGSLAIGPSDGDSLQNHDCLDQNQKFVLAGINCMVLQTPTGNIQHSLSNENLNRRQQSLVSTSAETMFFIKSRLGQIAGAHIQHIFFETCREKQSCKCYSFHYVSY